MDPKTSNDEPQAFSRVSTNDHAGQLWIVIILLLIYSLLSAIARVYIKHQMFGFNDLLLGLATILHIAQSAALFSTFAAIILCLLALSVTICSVLALILRIIDSKSGKTRPFCIRVTVLTLLLNCQAASLLTIVNIKECPSQAIRWTALTWLLIIQIAWSVNISLNHKLQVAIAFSFRLLLIAFSAIYTAYLSRYPASSEPQFAIINSLIFQQIMMGYDYEFSNTYPLHTLNNSRSEHVPSAAAGASTSVYDKHAREPREQPQIWRPGRLLDQPVPEGHDHNADVRVYMLDKEESYRTTGSQGIIIANNIAWNTIYKNH
ncbi:hypothetical protein V8C26DRAFT_424532 [Trichoderma gracile]